jgi:hypothetical protein
MGSVSACSWRLVAFCCSCSVGSVLINEESEESYSGDKIRQEEREDAKNVLEGLNHLRLSRLVLYWRQAY